ncbi:MAG: hypothetical protein F4040_03485 [Synechococcus sp. SB0670_bin_20]|nr:hypothetical protein [Synechococcus sp. SB0670_bin_20]
MAIPATPIRKSLAEAMAPEQLKAETKGINIPNSLTREILDRTCRGEDFTDYESVDALKRALS